MKKQISVRVEESTAKNLKMEALKNDITIQEILEKSVEIFLSNPQKWLDNAKNQTVK